MNIKTGYKQTEIGVIPEDWEVKTILNVAPLQRGFDLPNSKLEAGIYPVVCSNGIVNFHKIAMVKGAGVTTGRSGTLGKVHYIESDYFPHNTSLWVTNFFGNDVRFIYYLFTAIRLERFGSGSGVPTLNRNDVHDYKIPIPPKQEQTAIAAALSDVDALMGELDKLIAKKRDIKQATMQQLLTGKKRLAGFSGEWEIDFVENLAQITTGSKNTQDRIDDGQYPFFVRSQIVERINSYTFDGEAVLTAGDGVGTGKVFHYINGKFDTHQRVYLIFNFNSRINGYFFYLYFSSHFYNRIMQMTAKSSVDSVRKEMIAKMPIPHPPTIEEQTALATILSDMDAEISQLEARRAKTAQLKQGMMQELLTGRIRLVGASA